MKVILAFGGAASPWILGMYEALAEPIDALMLSDRADLAQSAEGFVRYVPSAGSPLRAAPSPVEPVVTGVLERFYPPWRRLIGLQRWVRNAQIVHTVELDSGPSLQAARLKRKHGFRLVVTVWQNIAWRKSSNPAARSAKSLVMQESDLFLAVSERARTALLLEGVDDARIRVVPPGVDLRHVSMPSERPHDSDRPFRLLMVAKKQRSKGVLEALQAVSLLVKDTRRAARGLELHCVGFSPTQGPYSSAVRRLGVSSCLVEHGAIPWSRIGEAYAQADVFLLPSRVTPLWQEQWGMVLTEARAAGLPIVATASGSIPEVAGPNALLACPNDHHTLFVQIRAVLENLEEHRRQAAVEALAVRERHAVERVAGRIAEEYHRLLT